MAKLFYKYGTMGSSKTANLLLTAYNYEERGQKAFLMKPMADDDGKDVKKRITSRVGLSHECSYVEDILDLPEDELSKLIDGYDVILVDEAQFLSRNYVDRLANIVDTHNIPVICYGLRTDFVTNSFPGILRLFEMADKMEEIKCMCFCGKKATLNLRMTDDGHAIKDGDQIFIGGNQNYVPLCRKHFQEIKDGDDVQNIRIEK